MITPEQKELVRTTFAVVVPIAVTAADLFYDRLFSTDPDTRQLFPADLAEQKKKLMQMLAVAVKGLDNLSTLVPAVEALGRRHATYGVTDEQYDSVGAALLWALSQGLGEAFTPAVEAAWAETYEVLAETMKNAAQAAA